MASSGLIPSCSRFCTVYRFTAQRGSLDQAVKFLVSPKAVTKTLLRWTPDLDALSGVSSRFDIAGEESASSGGKPFMIRYLYPLRDTLHRGSRSHSLRHFVSPQAVILSFQLML